ncbi:efflux RND transporter periplasmic adaptor subunit [Zoogloea sp.]|uniref:efflux RND transporter periplasmic adaptor subunit n=1 Tax=Zoogloea sp. TaxID=49181 RepID=UPI00141698A3|nr:MAG: efflux RND transporter periplasmic adaptor subunit [Zoogloea sp.]
MKSASLLQLIPLLGAGAVLAACTQDEALPPPPEAALVSTTRVAASSVRLEDELPGRVAAMRSAEIRPQVGGIVQKRLFEQGAEVREGQPLFQINPAPFKAEVDSADAALKRAMTALERARLQVERLEPLVEADAVSRQLYDDAVSQRNQAAADVAQARATLARRQLDLGFATIRAPISGRIGEEMVTEGALVSTTDTAPMARVQQIDQVYVDVRQPASMLETLRKSAGRPSAADGRAVILDAQGKPYPVKGEILFSGINVDAGTGDVVLRIRVENTGRHLLPGMYVRARVPQGGATEGILAPQQAIVRAGDGLSRVWVIDGDGKARQHAVQLGKVVDGHYLVSSGLKAGDKLVVEGLDRIKDGDGVTEQAWKGARPPASQAAR